MLHTLIIELFLKVVIKIIAISPGAHEWMAITEYSWASYDTQGH